VQLADDLNATVDVRSTTASFQQSLEREDALRPLWTVPRECGRAGDLSRVEIIAPAPEQCPGGPLSEDLRRASAGACTPRIL